MAHHCQSLIGFPNPLVYSQKGRPRSCRKVASRPRLTHGPIPSFTNLQNQQGSNLKLHQNLKLQTRAQSHQPLWRTKQLSQILKVSHSCRMETRIWSRRRRSTPPEIDSHQVPWMARSKSTIDIRTAHGIYAIHGELIVLRSCRSVTLFSMLFSSNYYPNTNTQN